MPAAAAALWEPRRSLLPSTTSDTLDRLRHPALACDVRSSHSPAQAAPPAKKKAAVGRGSSRSPAPSAPAAKKMAAVDNAPATGRPSPYAILPPPKMGAKKKMAFKPA